jgi:hypothetical protein
MKRSKALLVLCTAVVMMVCSGCFSMRALNMQSAMNDTVRKRDKTTPMEKTDKPISVTLQCESCVACYYAKDGDNGAAQCNGVSVAKEKAQEVLEPKSDADEKSLKYGLLMNDYANQLKRALELNLQKYASNVSITVATSPQSGTTSIEPTVTNYATGGSIFHKQTANVVLKASSADGSVVAEAAAKVTDNLSTSNLAWGIPIAIITFPIGMSIVSAVFQGMYTGVVE